MKDHIFIGATPAEEPCFPAGHVLGRAEAQIYARQLRREFPAVAFRVLAQPHEFGSYHEVVAEFDDDNEAQMDAAYATESGGSPLWDAAAQVEIAALLANIRIAS